MTDNSEQSQIPPASNELNSFFTEDEHGRSQCVYLASDVDAAVEQLTRERDQIRNMLDRSAPFLANIEAASALHKEILDYRFPETTLSGEPSPAPETSDGYRARLERAEKQLGALAVLILQNDRDEALEWARGVRITFPNGEPMARVDPSEKAPETTEPVHKFTGKREDPCTLCGHNAWSHACPPTNNGPLGSRRVESSQKASAFSGTPSSGMGCVVCGKLFFQGRPTCNCNGPQLSQNG